MDQRVKPKRGFSAVELLVVLAVGGIVVGGLLTLFRSQTAAARRQMLAADLQQSARAGLHELARACRMAGRGGLPVGLAITMRNNVGVGARSGGAGTPALVPGTDVLIVRGVFGSSPVEAAGGAAASSLTLVAEATADDGDALERLLEAARERSGEALLLSGGAGSPYCAVVELAGALGESRDASGRLAGLTLEYRTGGSAEAEAYAELGRACPVGPPGWIRRAAVLEEHRFYVRRGQASFGRAADHRLARARFLPGTDRRHPTSTAAGATLLDHALDLQVALGADVDGDGRIGDGSEAGGVDEWLYDRPGDRIVPIRVESVRLTLLLRAGRPTHGYLSPPLDRIEDHLFQESAAPVSAPESRRFQRRRATALVRLRR